MIVFVIFGAHAFIWGTTSTSVRQRAVPTEFQGPREQRSAQASPHQVDLAGQQAAETMG